MKNGKTLLLVLTSLSLSSCAIIPASSSGTTSSSSLASSQEESSSNIASSEKSTNSKESSSSTPSSTSEEPVISQYDTFFDPATKIEVTLDFTTQALQNLSDCGWDNSNTRYHDVYHPCTMSVKINDETTVIEEVGARMKGNTSRMPIMFNGQYTGGYINFKLSFNQKFDDETYPVYTPTSDPNRKDRLFLDEIKKLDFKWNKNYDSTFTKELYAQYMLEEEGLMAQKVNMCKVSIKQDGEPLQGYTDVYYHVYETVDKPFLKRRLDSKEAKGDLYKSAWPATLNEFSRYGVEDNYNDRHFVYNLKTNEDDSNHLSLKNCIEKINQTGAVTSKIKTDLESVVDIDYFLKYAAMMWVIGNPDDLRYNTNNTYFYFNSKNNKLYLIPYDNDRCFGILQDWPVDLSQSGPLDKRNCNSEYPYGQVESHLFWRTILPISTNSYPVVEEWSNKYVEYCHTYANKYLDTSKFQKFTNRFTLAPSKNIDVAGGENQTFAGYAFSKLGTLD